MLGDLWAFLLMLFLVNFTWPYKGVEEYKQSVELEVDLDRVSQTDKGHACMPREKTNFPRQRGIRR